MSGSIEHYRAALRLEPDYPGGVAQLRIPSCYVKYHLGQGAGQQPDPGPGVAGHCHAPGHGGQGCKGPDGEKKVGSVRSESHVRSPEEMLINELDLFKLLIYLFSPLRAVQRCSPRSQCCRPLLQAGCRRGSGRRGGARPRGHCDTCHVPSPAWPSYEVSLARSL